MRGIHPARVTFTFRPITKWDQPRRETESCRFRSSPGTTQDELRCELAKLGVDRCVLQADLDESQIRLDGMPYAGARFRSGRVILTFDHPEQGTLNFPCATYSEFWNNVRAIVKTMESLRAIDRYGVTKNSEQFAGWKQLPSTAIVAQEFVTVEEAMKYIISHSEGWILPEDTLDDAAAQALDDHELFRSAFRNAAKNNHPDHGGDPKIMDKLNRARAMVQEHFGRAA